MALSMPARAQSKDETIAELKAQLSAMQAQLRDQQALIERMQQRLSGLESQEPVVAAPAAPPSTPQAQPATAPHFSQYEPASRIHKPPSALAGVGEPPPEGYTRLGETGTFLKLDVIAQLDLMFDNKFMGEQDLFVPSSIPVQGAPFHDSDRRSNLSARQSAVRMDFRRDTPYGLLKVVYLNNFFGDGGQDMDYNLQYLYGELEADDFAFRAGYGNSAFTDIDAFPNTLDYEGPNSFTFKYTPQIRYSPVLHRRGEGRLTLPMSLEKPNADIAMLGDYAPYSRWPDFTLGLRWETPDWHVQWANLLRDLAVQSAIDDTTRNTDAYATQLSFAAGVFGDDSVQGWASTGKGYADFLQDIAGLGLDAAFDPRLELEAIDAYGYGAGYTHAWSDALSSSASYGYLKIDPDADLLLDPTLPESTVFASLNLAWQFSERAMMGAEWLWGRQRDLTGATGEAQRVQVSLRYDLNP